MKKPALQLLWILLLACAVPVHGSESVQGLFQATRNCEAYLSFRKGTNPGQVQIVAGSGYAIREVHARAYHWVRIEIPGIANPLRWVATECGVVRDLIFTRDLPSPKEFSATCTTPGLHDSYVLAVSWQPGFCVHFPYQSSKPECDWLASGDLVIAHVTLHGLWPNRIECGHEYGYCGAEDMHLDEDTLAFIRPWMPNFYFEETFGRYQWDKHGTCQNDMDANTYFRTAVAAVIKINESEIGRYITENIGNAISKKQLFQRINHTVGEQRAANSFQLLCKGPYLYEIRIKLPREFQVDGDWTDFLGGDLPDQREPHRHACREDKILIEGSAPAVISPRVGP
jgi:ribonuclease T2